MSCIYVHTHVTLRTDCTWNCYRFSRDVRPKKWWRLLIWWTWQISESGWAILLATKWHCIDSNIWKNNQGSIMEPTPVTDDCNLLVYMTFWSPTHYYTCVTWTLDLCLQNGKRVTAGDYSCLLFYSELGVYRAPSSISMANRVPILLHWQISCGLREPQVERKC